MGMYEVVLQLTGSQANEPGIHFPPGCRVCNDHQTSSDHKLIESHEGVVVSVGLGRNPSQPLVNGLVYIYQVESLDEERGNVNSADFVQEDLSYAPQQMW
ncbi:hypothetical protein ACHAWO_004312 [Cyclotella atomus]|uniref:Uncharacterized protein n=1 Tax=Cyclotella atomus TaxID=382360 RepID=A0ABD3P8V1_9STRA